MKKSQLIYPNALALLDLDGVVAKFSDRVVDLYNERHGGNLNMSEWNSFYMEKVWGEEVWKKMEKIYNEEGFFESLEPYVGSLGVVNEIAKMLNVEVCSSPTKRYKDDGSRELNPHCAFEKYEWVHKYMPMLSSNITLTTEKYRVKADFLIDDGAHNLHRWCAAHPRSKGFMVARLWNESAKVPKNASRGTLEEVPEFIKKTLDDK